MRRRVGYDERDDGRDEHDARRPRRRMGEADEVAIAALMALDLADVDGLSDVALATLARGLRVRRGRRLGAIVLRANAGLRASALRRMSGLGGIPERSRRSWRHLVLRRRLRRGFLDTISSHRINIERL